MAIVATVLVALVALLHAWFLTLEMFLWEKPIGLKTFRNTPEKAAITAVLAKNQGLYNGFLVAGLVWGLILAAQGAPEAKEIQQFFLACVVVAGGYGAATVSPRIFVVQGVPALLAFAAVTIGRL
jgi:putative membrane protein